MHFRLSCSFGDTSSWWRVTAPKTICCSCLCPTRWSETCRSTCLSCPIYFRRYLNSRFGCIHSRQSRGDNRQNDHTRKCIVRDTAKVLTFMSEPLASIEMPQYVRGTRRPHGLATATTNSLPPTPVPVVQSSDQADVVSLRCGAGYGNVNPLVDQIFTAS